MKVSLPLLGLFLILISHPGSAMNPFFPIAEEKFLMRIGATDCQGPIATEAHPLFAPETDPDRLLRMRREGKLPDRFVCGRCEYSLAGDTGAAYYVKKCK